MTETTTTVQQPQQQARPTVNALLKYFVAQPGCEKYAGDSAKIVLLHTYLWLRQLTLDLPFELFLDRFAPLADHDSENRKHPEDALKFHCPRAKKAAEELGVEQWSAKECYNITTLYIDMVREAEATGTLVSLTYDQMLEALKQQVKEGQFDFSEPKEPRASKSKSPKVPEIERPIGEDQRVIYKRPHAREIRGVTTAVFESAERTYVNLTADDGQLFDGVNVNHVFVIDEEENPRAAAPQDLNGESLSEIGSQKIWIPKVQYASVLQALSIKDQPMGNVDIGDVIYPYMAVFSDGIEANIDIVNGESGPFVDARLSDPGDGVVALAELPPRDVIDGEYKFVTAAGYYTVTVEGRK